MEPDFPIEIFLSGNPRSLQAAAQSLRQWKATVSDAIRDKLPENAFLSEAPMKATFIWFSDSENVGDLDNILKPILDACVRVVIVDDDQVQSISADLFPPSRIADFSNPTATLAQALDADRPGVYFRLEERQ
ncbi:RusA family crossover junction endodeoxyribonuclease [Maricaulis sp.]|uniref:RusA family crossover junction endodeoxyribonuclease n=1 Tax=Maricaulis sp. TaxID=1486257 RepID=UPI003A8C95B4